MKNKLKKLFITQQVPFLHKLNLESMFTFFIVSHVVHFVVRIPNQSDCGVCKEPNFNLTSIVTGAEPPAEHECKVILLGLDSSGKTSILYDTHTLPVLIFQTFTLYYIYIGTS